MNNVIIVGGGPAGYSAAIYLARAGLSPLVVEGTTGGGQLALTTEVENYPGFPEGIMGPELVLNFRKQAERFDTRFVTENVTSINYKSQITNHKQITNFKLQITNGKEFETQSVLIATGADAMWLGLPSEQRLRGKGVSACATCDGFFFRNKIVAVVGGGDTALEEALTLTKFATKVYLIHRRDEFRASKIMVERARQNPKIEIIFNAEVTEVLGENKVEGVVIRVQKQGLEAGQEDGSKKLKKITSIPLPNLTSTYQLQVDGLFIAIGHKPATGFLEGSGVLLDKKGYIITRERAAIELVNQQNDQFSTSNLQINTKQQIPNKPHLASPDRGGLGGVKLETSNENLDIENSLKIAKLKIENYRYATSVPGLFAAGDCVDHVYRQAGTAVGMGIAAALEIQNFLEENFE